MQININKIKLNIVIFLFSSFYILKIYTAKPFFKVPFKLDKYGY